MEHAFPHDLVTGGDLAKDVAQRRRAGPSPAQLSRQPAERDDPAAESVADHDAHPVPRNDHAQLAQGQGCRRHRKATGADHAEPARSHFPYGRRPTATVTLSVLGAAEVRLLVEWQ